MLFKDFLTQSYSERNYDNRDVEDSKFMELLDYTSGLQKSSGIEKVKFVLFKDGPKLYKKLDGFGGYNGVMINSLHYIGLKIKDTDYKTIIYSAYAMQALMKKAFELGLGTCWISIKDVPEKLLKELIKDEEERLYYLIAIGYPDKTADSLEPSYTYLPTGKSGMSNNPYDGIIAEKPSTSGSRLSILDIVYLKEWGNPISLEELENRGLAEVFHSVKNAPSTKNNQPWRFVIKGGEILLGVLNPRQCENLTDAGIVIFLLEGLINDLSIPVLWQYTDMKINEYNGEEYAIVGRFII